MRLFVLSFLTLAIAPPALAVDGVLEINQTCATTDGCFSGDSGGFPVTITQTGSYRLTGNLAVNNVAVKGIQISALNVSLDLNGFEVAGITSCTGSGASIACTPTFSTGHAIEISSANAEVRDGTVRGAGGDGVRIEAPGAQILRVRATENGEQVRRWDFSATLADVEG